MDFYSLNRVILVGYVGQKPIIRISKPSPSVKTPRKMAKFQLATRALYKNSKNPRTVWHYCYAWGTRADFIEKYITPGTLLLIEGKLDNFTMKDAEGKARKHIFVSVDVITFMPTDRREAWAAPAASAEDDSLPEGAKDPIDEGNPFL